MTSIFISGCQITPVRARGFFLAFVLGLGLLPIRLLAEGPAATAAPAAMAVDPATNPNNVCNEFRIKYCGGMKFPSTEFSDCMYKHRTDFTPACRSDVERTWTCHEAAMKNCKEFPLQSRAHLDCMLKHKKDIPADCYETIEKKKQFWDVCKAPIEKFCPTLPNPQTAYCLWDHKTELTGDCSKLLFPPTLRRKPPTQAAPNNSAKALPKGLALPGGSPPPAVPTGKP
jgi:hypothetical protein